MCRRIKQRGFKHRCQVMKPVRRIGIINSIFRAMVRSPQQAIIRFIQKGVKPIIIFSLVIIHHPSFINCRYICIYVLPFFLKGLVAPCICALYLDIWNPRVLKLWMRLHPIKPSLIKSYVLLPIYRLVSSDLRSVIFSSVHLLRIQSSLFISHIWFI